MEVTEQTITTNTSNIKNINDFKFEDFELVDYHPHPHIKASVSV